MHRRLVFAVSLVLFALLSLLATVITDLNDRSFPKGLNARSALSLDFSQSDMDDLQAFTDLATQDQRWNLGLVKVAPDLSDDSDRVFISITPGNHPARDIRLFRPSDRAQLRDASALSRSYATGQYLITSRGAEPAGFQSWLKDHRVGVTWVDNSVSATVRAVTGQSEFLIAVFAAVVLFVALILYWLTVLAHGRALRVLGGTPVARVQLEDLVGVTAPVAVAAVMCGAAVMAIVGAHSGWMFTPELLRTVAVLFGTVLVATVVMAVVMSVASLPSPKMLANRTPGVVTLRKGSAALKIATFLLVIATIGPAVGSYQHAAQVSQQQAQWRSLSQQVRVAVNGALGETGFQRIKDQLGATVLDAQRTNGVAFSYTWTSDIVSATGSARPSQDLALVSPSWLALMKRDLASSKDFTPDPGAASLPTVREFLAPNMVLWKRETSADVFHGMQFLRFHSSKTLPLASAGSGDLIFARDALLVVVPDVHAAFNNDYLGSIMSTGNLLFNGADATTLVLHRNKLYQETRVVYAAAEGVLRAQFAAYFAWLRGVSLASMVIALLIATAVSALISAIVSAKRDFPLLLNGTSPPRIITDRASTEVALIAGLTLIIATYQSFERWWAPAMLAVLAILAAPVVHGTATRWCFQTTVQRKL
jgi:hypothetical protein